MASTSGSGNGYTLTLNVNQVSQNINDNTSTVNWSLTFHAGTNYYQNNTTSDRFVVTINGQQVYNQLRAVSFPSRHSTLTITTGSLVVPHNADGTKSFSFDASFTAGKSASYYPPSMSSGHGAIYLSTIPRATSITAKSAFYLGTAQTYLLPRASSGFTHRVRYSIGSSSVTIGSGYTTSFTYTFPASLASHTPNSISGGFTLYVDTFSGSTLIGTKSVWQGFTVPTDIIPSITSQVFSDPTGNLTKFGAYVRTKSNLKAVIGSAGSYGSTIKSVTVVHNGVTKSGSTVTFTSIGTSGSVTITVVDSRGRKAVKTVSAFSSSLAYNAPAITSLSVYRSDSLGTLNETGEFIKVSITYAVTALNNKNTSSLKLESKVQTAASWTVQKTWTGYSATVSHVLPASGNSRYDIRVTLSDYFGSFSADRLISTAFTLMNFRNTGKGIAFGKVSEKDTFECDITSEFTKAVYMSQLLTIYNRLKMVAHGVTSEIGSQNASYTHYFTDAPYGHYFNKPIHVNGEIYATSNYNTPIVARGYNANGSYTKYYDGTLICFAKPVISGGNAFYASKNVSFPVAFTTAPFVTMSIEFNANTVDQSGYTASYGSITTTGIQLKCGSYQGKAPTGGINISYIAVGRWK